MGWLGWTEQQTLDTTIPAIELAFENRMEMVQAMAFGSLRGSGLTALPAEPEPPSFDQVAGTLRAFATAAKK